MDDDPQQSDLKYRPFFGIPPGETTGQAMGRGTAPGIEKTRAGNETGEAAGLICIFEDAGRGTASDEAVVERTVDSIVLSWKQDAESVALCRRREELPEILEALGCGEPIYALKNAGGKVVGAIAFGRDITERKRAEEALQKSHRDLAFNLNRIASIVAATPGEEMFAQVLDAVLEVTRSEFGALGHVAAGCVRSSVARIGGTCRAPGRSTRFVRRQWTGYWGQALREKRVVYSNNPADVFEAGLPMRRVMVAPLLDRDEAIGYIEIANKGDDYDEGDRAFLEGIAKSLAPVLRAMAQRDAHEKALSTALAAKQVLLQEVHHRVKNNLQIIASLLNLQAESLPDTARKALDESQRRVRSMALIHEQLYTNGDVGRLDFGEYAKVLCTELFGAYGATPNLVNLRLELDPVTLDMNEATPCGLILNEIIANSLKYAFPDSRSGEILVALHCGSGNMVSLRVADNGVGMPPGLDWKASKTLGLRIVDILARQLDGNLRLEAGEGTDFTLTFVKREG